MSSNARCSVRIEVVFNPGSSRALRHNNNVLARNPLFNNSCRMHDCQLFFPVVFLYVLGLVGGVEIFLICMAMLNIIVKECQCYSLCRQ